MIITVTPNISLDNIITLQESFKVGEVNRVDKITYVPGGKGVNASRALLCLCYKAPVLGFVGGDTGKHILSIFDHEGIVYDVVEINGESRKCYNILDLKSDTHTQTEILGQGPGVTQNDIDSLKDKILKHLSENAIVCMGGSLPSGAPKTLYADIINLIQSKGGKVILDTSGDALIEGIKAKPFSIKPNRKEVEKILDFELDTLDNIKKALCYFSNAGVKLSVISMGKDGLYAYYEGKYYKVTPPTIPNSQVINPVGSGDSVVAGIALGLEQNLDIAEILRLGAAMGTANVLTLKPGEIRKSDLEDILPKVEVEVIYKKRP